MFRHSDPEGRTSNSVVSGISVVLMETTLTILDSIEAGSPVECEIVRVVSLSTMEVTEMTQFTKLIFRVRIP